MILSWLNQRDQVTIFNGTWDKALLAFGLSGFLIVSGPVFLLLADSTFREIVYHGSNAKIRGAGLNPSAASLLSIGWLVFLWILVTWVVKKSGRRTAIYNVIPTSLLDSLRDRSAELNFQIQETSPKIQLDWSNGESLAFQIDHQQFSYHSTVIWDQPFSPLRKRVEEIWRQTAIPPAENLVGGWLFTSSLVIFIAVLIWAGFLIYLLMTSGRP